MKPPRRGRAGRKPPAPTAGTGGARPPSRRSRDLRIDATPEQLAVAIGAGPPKAAHEWNYLKPKPVQSEREPQPQ